MSPLSLIPLSLFLISLSLHLSLSRCEMFHLVLGSGRKREQQVTRTHFTSSIAMCYTTINCNTLQYAETHTATHCNTLQHTHCNTLQHTATHTATHCNTLQHTTTHCITLQHTATHCNRIPPTTCPPNCCRRLQRSRSCSRRQSDGPQFVLDEQWRSTD